MFSPVRGANSAPANPLAGFQGPLAARRKEREKGMKERGIQ